MQPMIHMIINSTSCKYFLAFYIRKIVLYTLLGVIWISPQYIRILHATIEEKEIGLAIIYVGDNPASDVYVKNKLKYADQVGINAKLFKLGDLTTEEELIKLINYLNNDESIHGIILQSPIPSNLDFDFISNKITSTKDVDGFTTNSIYANYTNTDGFIPCTVRGIIKLLKY